MRLVITVATKQKTWSRQVVEISGKVVWEELNRPVTDYELTEEGVFAWANQMVKLPQWNIVEFEYNINSAKTAKTRKTKKNFVQSRMSVLANEAGKRSVKPGTGVIKDYDILDQLSEEDLELLINYAKEEI